MLPISTFEMQFQNRHWPFLTKHATISVSSKHIRPCQPSCFCPPPQQTQGRPCPLCFCVSVPVSIVIVGNNGPFPFSKSGQEWKTIVPLPTKGPHGFPQCSISLCLSLRENKSLCFQQYNRMPLVQNSNINFSGWDKGPESGPFCVPFLSLYPCVSLGGRPHLLPPIVFPWKGLLCRRFFAIADEKFPSFVFVSNSMGWTGNGSGRSFWWH